MTEIAVLATCAIILGLQVALYVKLARVLSEIPHDIVNGVAQAVYKVLREDRGQRA